MGCIVRKDNWPKYLYEFIDSRRKVPFKYGENDCALFAADAIKAISYDVDFGEPYRGKYDSYVGYVKLIKEINGCVCLEALATSLLGQPCPTKYVKRGDVVLIQIENRQSLGICIGAKSACPGKNGLDFINTHPNTIKGWSI